MTDIPIPPQWRPDPNERSGYRYWDGSDWSSLTAPSRAGQVALGPPPPPLATQTAGESVEPLQGTDKAEASVDDHRAVAADSGAAEDLADLSDLEITHDSSDESGASSDAMSDGTVDEEPEPSAVLPAPLLPPAPAEQAPEMATDAPAEADEKKPGAIGRLFGKKSKSEKEASDEARTIIASIMEGLGDAVALSRQLVEVQDRAHLADRQKRQGQDIALRAVVSRVLDDDILSRDEEAYVLEVMSALGIQESEIGHRCPDVLSRVLIGRIQDGRMPVVAQPRLMTKAGEVVYAEMAASLLKEVVHREYRGGSSGISFPILPGVRMRTGGFRGRSVVVGTSWEPADDGFLSFTSTRALFQGSKKTLEFRYDRMTGVEAYSDGVRMSVSNRQAASLFGATDGVLAATIVLAAAQRAGHG